MQQQKQSDGLATPEQVLALKAAYEADTNERVERLMTLAEQVSLYYNFLVKKNNMETYIALQLAQALQTSLMRGG